MTPDINLHTNRFSVFPNDTPFPVFVPITDPDEMQRVPYRAGYGSCSKCYCREYEGNGWQCVNCGHRYEDHW